MKRTTGIATTALCALAIAASANANAGGDKKDKSAQQSDTQSGGMGNGAMGNGAMGNGAMGNGEGMQKSAQKPEQLTMQKVMQRPSKYFGKTVSITAPVGTLHGDHVFALRNDQPGGKELYVLLPKEPAKSVPSQETVTIEGTLREFVDADVYIQHDELRPTEDAATLRTQPVLVASRITTSGGSALLEPMTSDQRMASAERVQGNEIAKSPDQYFGKTVRLDGASINRVENRHLILLDEDQATPGPDIAVINPRPSSSGQAPQQGDLEIVGRVQPFDEKQLEQQYKGLNVSTELARQLDGRPVVIAESLRTEGGTELVQSPTGMGK